MEIENDYIAAMREIARRLDEHEKFRVFIESLANWSATTDNWYNTFNNFQKEAKILIDNQ